MVESRNELLKKEVADLRDRMLALQSVVSALGLQGCAGGEGDNRPQLQAVQLHGLHGNDDHAMHHEMPSGEQRQTRQERAPGCVQSQQQMGFDMAVDVGVADAVQADMDLNMETQVMMETTAGV